MSEGQVRAAISGNITKTIPEVEGYNLEITKKVKIKKEERMPFFLLQYYLKKKVKLKAEFSPLFHLSR